MLKFPKNIMYKSSFPISKTQNPSFFSLKLKTMKAEIPKNNFCSLNNFSELKSPISNLQKKNISIPANNSPSFFEDINKSCCNGCGVKLQITDPYEEGYIDYKVFAKYLSEKIDESRQKSGSNLDKEIEKYLKFYKENASNETPDLTAENVDPQNNENSLENLESNFFESFWRKKSFKNLNCLRCQKIKNHEYDEILKIKTRVKSLIMSNSCYETD